MSLPEKIKSLLGFKKDYFVKVASLQEEEKEQGISPPAERTQTRVAPEELELLYKTDPLVFGMVHEYVQGIASDFFIEGGEEEHRRRLEQWCRDVGLLFKIQDAIVDICIHGTAWLELNPNYKNKTLKVKYINPKIIDYIRDNMTGNVKLADDGKPEGYIIQTGLNKIEIYRDKIVRNGETIIESDGEDLRTRIVPLKLWSFGESYLGLSLLGIIYKSAKIRLNIADMVGESAFRAGGIYASVPRDASQQTKDNLLKELLNITRRNVFVFDERINVGTLPVPDLRGHADLIYYFADEIGVGMKVPTCLLMSTQRVTGTDRDMLAVKFELSLKPLQERLAYQIREKIFTKLWDVWGYSSEIPRIVFKERAPFMQLSRSRRIATLARRGLIRRDPELEMRLRQEEGLPTKFVQRELDYWLRHEEKVPEKTREIDYIERPDKEE